MVREFGFDPGAFLRADGGGRTAGSAAGAIVQHGARAVAGHVPGSGREVWITPERAGADELLGALAGLGTGGLVWAVAGARPGCDRIGQPPGRANDQHRLPGLRRAGDVENPASDRKTPVATGVAGVVGALSPVRSQGLDGDCAG